MIEEDLEKSLFESSTRSRINSRMTQEWLEEARWMVASSPSRCDSPSRLVGSPRFAAAAQVGRSSAAVLERSWISQCTILADNYCEDAYDLLQTSLLKKLLLAGILLDTRNLNSSSQSSMTRDTETVQLVLVGSNPNYRTEFYDQLMEEQRDKSFSEALQINYGNPPLDSDKKKPVGIRQNEGNVQNSDKKQPDSRKTNRDSLKPAKPVEAPVEATAPEKGGKNKFFLAKWLGFGSK